MDERPARFEALFAAFSRDIVGLGRALGNRGRTDELGATAAPAAPKHAQSLEKLRRARAERALRGAN
jgi:hypothetical protein